MKRSNEESLEIQFHKRSKFTSFPSMDYIINNPGLQNIIELIFLNLDFEELLVCQLINKSCKEILDNPMFWLKKWRFGQGLSQKNYLDWTKVIQITRDTNLEENVCSYIKKIIQIGHNMVNVPCFIDNEAIRKFYSKNWTFEETLIREEFGILQIIASKEQKKYYDQDSGHSIIYLYTVSSMHNTEIACNAIKILAPLMEKPNFPGFWGTPIVIAALKGSIDVVQSLIPYIKNANEFGTNEFGFYTSPMSAAIHNGHTEIVKILAPLCKEFLYSDKYVSGNLIHYAIGCNKPETIKIFAYLLDDPNAPDSDGLTPIEMAQNRGLTGIVKFLKKIIAAKVLLQIANTAIPMGAKQTQKVGVRDLETYLVKYF